MGPASFETQPEGYRHVRLEVSGDVAQLILDVDPQGALNQGDELKLNSYDLGVDIELADAVRRLRFEHPSVRAVIVRSGHPRVFCAGANIPALQRASHAFKVNFCKFTNETRLAIEDACQHSGQHYIAALRGAAAGGGYELALSCERILLVDDGHSAISLPEVPLLGVLPGTGGLTRLVDKRRVRPDHADLLCTSVEGIGGERALRFGLCDALATASRFEEVLAEQVDALAPAKSAPDPGIVLRPLLPEVDEASIRYRHVRVRLDHAGRTASLHVRAPEQPPPSSTEELEARGDDAWAIRAFRELDDAMLRLRFHYPELGLWLLRTEGDPQRVAAHDAWLAENAQHWLARETCLLQRQVLRRLDVSARSLFAVADAKSCFAGVLLELSLAADRCYALDDPDAAASFRLSPANDGRLATWQGIGRLSARGVSEDASLFCATHRGRAISAAEAESLGLVTLSLDGIDFDDELRVAIEERASLSPDALTAMEANLRGAGPETWQSKIFARLTAWQNWVFARPNATGPCGALSRYGAPERAEFDLQRC